MGRKTIAEIAEESGRHRSTIWRWIRATEARLGVKLLVPREFCGRSLEVDTGELEKLNER